MGCGGAEEQIIDHAVLHCPIHRPSGVRRKFSWGEFIQWNMVVICIWCALFATSQFDVKFMFPN